MLEQEVTGSQRSSLYHRFHIEYIKLSFVILSVIVAKKEFKIFITVMLDVNKIIGPEVRSRRSPASNSS